MVYGHEIGGRLQFCCNTFALRLYLAVVECYSAGFVVMGDLANALCSMHEASLLALNTQRLRLSIGHSDEYPLVMTKAVLLS